MRGYPAGVRASTPLRTASCAAQSARARRDAVPEAYVYRVLQLVRNGEEVIDFTEFDTDWQGEAYQTVSGQNANNSVRVTADFLDAVREDREWNLIRRTDGGVAKTLPARALWDRVALAAWQSADPGVQYDTTINEWHTAPAGGRIRGSNPCSEYMFLDDTACNLASLNLLRFWTPRDAGIPGGDEETGTFDTEAYTHASRLWTIVLEISVLMAQYPSPAIAQLSYDYRTLGLGYANLGALLMVQGIPYDSPEALAQTSGFTALLTGRLLRHLGGDGARARPVPRVRGEPRGDAARHPQPPPCRPRRPRGRVRGSDGAPARPRRRTLPHPDRGGGPRGMGPTRSRSARRTATATRRPR